MTPNPQRDEEIDRLQRIICSKLELKTGFAEAHAKSRALQQWIGRFDTNGTGRMDRNEFFNALNRLNLNGEKPDYVDGLFDRFDRDDTGCVSLKELSDGLFGVVVVPEAKPEIRHLLAKVRSLILKRAALGGDPEAVGVSRMTATWRRMDRDRSGRLNVQELQSALDDYGVELSPQEVRGILKAFGSTNGLDLDLTGFLKTLRGRMPERRRALVRLAYNCLDTNRDERVTLKELSAKYDTANHPSVVSGKMTEEEVMAAFVSPWDGDGNHTVTCAEFQEYYEELSCGIDSDDYFELMIRNAWHISGGSGAAENTTCRRVLVVHKDGSQTVEEIKNDLTIGPNDIEKMKAALMRQGINDIKRVFLNK